MKSHPTSPPFQLLAEILFVIHFFLLAFVFVNFVKHEAEKWSKQQRATKQTLTHIAK
jgi:hypothetical protein